MNESILLSAYGVAALGAIIFVFVSIRSQLRRQKQLESQRDRIVQELAAAREEK